MQLLQREDPTRTQRIRRDFEQHLHDRFDDVIQHIEIAFLEVDTLNVNIEDRLRPEPGQFDFPRDPQSIDEFENWLEAVLTVEVLTKYEGDGYIRQAAGRGISHADDELRRIGVEPGESDITTILRQPVHRDKLELMYTRSFGELDGITSATQQQLRRELTDGLAKGHDPETIARNMTDRVEGIKRNRASVLAQTEVIRSHSEFTLDRYEQIAGDIGVTVRAEFTTAGDDRVCAICEALEGETYSITEMRTSTFSPEGFEDRAVNEFPVQPPVHPRCRCSVIPSIAS